MHLYPLILKPFRAFPSSKSTNDQVSKSKITCTPDVDNILVHFLLENQLMIEFQIVKSPAPPTLTTFSSISYLKIDQ